MKRAYSIGCLSLVLVAGASAGIEGDLKLSVELQGAAGPQKKGLSSAVLATFAREDGYWMCCRPEVQPRFNVGFHRAVVDKAAVGEDEIELKLVVHVGDDAWMKGDLGHYDVKVRKTADGRYEGTCRGSYGSQAVDSRATVTLEKLPAPVITRTDIEPVKPGDHPRILFRKQDVPALKKKAGTPFGKAAMEKMTGAMGAAVRYQLEGDRKYAEEARAETEKLMADTGIGDKRVRSRVFGWRLEEIGIAYDMCADAWPADFRDKVREHILFDVGRPFYQIGAFHHEIAWDVRALYPGPIRYGPAIAMLALWGATGPEPEPPAAPDMDVPLVKPDPDYKPGNGVTVSDFVSDKMPKEWLLATGFVPEEGEDPLKPLGGVEKARPRLGDKVTVGDRTDAFRALEHDEKKGDYGDKIEMVRATGRAWKSTSYLYTAIRNDRTRRVQVRTGDPRDTVYLAGVPLVDGDFIRIEPGIYPVLVKAIIGKTVDWGVIFKQPRLAEMTDDEIKTFRDGKVAYHEVEMAFWRNTLERWKRDGGMDVRVASLFELTRNGMIEYARLGYADGFKGADLGSIDGPNKYMCAYRNAFCRNLTPEQDMELFIPRQMFVTLFRGEGGPVYQDIHDTLGYAYGEYAGSFDLAANVFGLLFPLVKKEWQPQALWAWKYTLGVKGDSDFDRILRSGVTTLPGYPGASQAAWALVNYPLDMAPEKPGSMPLTFSTPARPWYGFRNKWLGDDACLFQVAAACGRKGAGAFRLAGFGERWMVGNSGRRMYETVVQVPGVEINESAGGSVTHYESGRDGSGALTVNLDAVYDKEKTGVSGFRALGVDFSGKSGATALVAIADKVEGAKETLWWCPFIDGGFLAGRMWDAVKPEKKPRNKAEKDALYEKVWNQVLTSFRAGDKQWKEYAGKRDAILAGMKTEGNTFSITKDDVTLMAHVFSDKPVSIKTDDLEERSIGAKASGLISVCSGIAARGGTEYLVVITLSKGEPPKVKSSGEGLKTEVTVGKAKVSFDGAKIVME